MCDLHEQFQKFDGPMDTSRLPETSCLVKASRSISNNRSHELYFGGYTPTLLFLLHPLLYLILTYYITVTMDEETRQTILESDSFKEFFEKTTRVMDRALYLSESLDFMSDYKHDEAEAGYEF